MSVNIGTLDLVIEKTIQTVEESKHQIFEIAEQARSECMHLKAEIESIKNEVLLIIEKGDKLDMRLKKSRFHLSEVSQNFLLYSEEDIRNAYEEANQLQLEYSLLQEKEKQLRTRRDEMQLRLRNLEQTVEKAEALTTQIGVVLDYLSGDIRQASQALEDVQEQQLIGLKVIQAQEEERKRVAREIHDGPAQSLANVTLRTELIEKILMQDEIERAKEELNSLKTMLRDSIADVRRIIFDLRPMALDDLG
ncbi:sensor histidine kinase [Caldalkalibacillus mannanilyticus]|uniref:sensor histidine kinase n=1 Tax=Caldalkalibacillus mannanilyticus TaxID=1418 RepID=UPI000AC768F7